jgi:hypothetical protein
MIEAAGTSETLLNVYQSATRLQTLFIVTAVRNSDPAKTFFDLGI